MFILMWSNARFKVVQTLVCIKFNWSYGANSFSTYSAYRWSMSTKATVSSWFSQLNPYNCLIKHHQWYKRGQMFFVSSHDCFSNFNSIEFKELHIALLYSFIIWWSSAKKKFWDLAIQVKRLDLEEPMNWFHWVFKTGRFKYWILIFWMI